MTLNEINQIIFQTEDNEVNEKLDEQKHQVNRIIQNNPELGPDVQVISSKELKSKLNKPDEEMQTKKVAEIMASKLTPMEQIAEIQKLLKNSKKENPLNHLQKYYVVNMQGVIYIAPVSKGSQGSKISSFESTLSNGDKVQLIRDNVKSEIYTYQDGELLDKHNNTIKPSKAVELFMVNQVKVKLPDNFKGYPGLAHQNWVKL